MSPEASTLLRMRTPLPKRSMARASTSALSSWCSSTSFRIRSFCLSEHFQAGPRCHWVTLAGRRCRHGGCCGIRWRVHAVVGGWDEAGVEDLLVHGGLESLVETLGFGGDVVGGHQLGFNGNGELVGRVAGEAEALGVICDQFDGHDGIGWAGCGMGGNEKARRDAGPFHGWGGVCPLRLRRDRGSCGRGQYPRPRWERRRGRERPRERRATSRRRGGSWASGGAALAVKRADHVVGEFRAVEVAWHDGAVVDGFSGISGVLCKSG